MTPQIKERLERELRDYLVHPQHGEIHGAMKIGQLGAEIYHKLLLECADLEFDPTPANEFAETLLDPMQSDYFVGGAKFQWERMASYMLALRNIHKDNLAQIAALKAELEAARETVVRAEE